MAYIYEKVTACLSKPPHERDKEELNVLEPWVRKKSKLFASLLRETVLDVIKHCEFIKKKANEPVIIQGEKGYSFYIILKGSVSVLIKESVEEETNLREADRSKLGVQVSVLGDGAAFGELALLSEDCVRTASIVADEPTDLVVIHRDLYNRSVARVVKKEYEDKFNFVEGCPIFKNWAQRWKKHLAIAMTKNVYNYEDVVVRQGNKADRMYFILSGEVKLVVDPDSQAEQFRDFMDQCAPLIEDGREVFSRFSRREPVSNVNRIKKLLEEKQKEHATSSVLESMTITPSVIRKQLLFHRQHSEKINLSLLGAGKIIGDVEFLLNLQRYHANVVCTHETEVLWIHKAHFDRLFRKRNPGTLKAMAHFIRTQVNARLSRESLLRKLPFFRCLQLKLNELTQEKKPTKEEDPANLPQVNMDNMLIRQRSYSQTDYRLPDSYRRSHSRSQTPIDGAAYAMRSSNMAALLQQHGQVGSTTTLTTSTTTAAAAAGNPTPGSPTAVPVTTQSLPGGSTVVASGPGAGGSDVIIIDRPLLNPREGIFVKLMQISNPEATADHLLVDEEEFDYLIQLRRRIAKEFQDFSMGKKVPYSEGLEGTIERPCRKGSRATTRQLAKRMFPMLLTKPRGSGGHSHSAGSGGRRALRLPQF